MTDRRTASTINDAELDHLYAENARLTTELAALREVAHGYCPECGRGDASPTADQWMQQRQRADRAEAALARVKAVVAEHPAGIDTALIEEALDQPKDQP